MTQVNFLAFIPKAALFLLLIVAGAILAEIFYFRRKREPKITEVILPPTPPTPQTPLVETIIQTPPSATFLPPPEKRRLSRKTLTALLVVFLITASIPVAVVLVRQRQEVRKKATEGCPPASCTGNGYLCAGDCACNWEQNKGVRWHYKCVDGKVESYNEFDAGCNSACPGGPSPSPTPSPGCRDTDCFCQADEDCNSGVCHYEKCATCGGFDEPTCWTHKNCYWFNGACAPKPLTSPSPGAGNLVCEATIGGMSVKNNTTQNLTGCQASYFACGVPRSSRAECEANPGCSGSSSSTTFNLSIGESKSFSGASINCGVWQTDLHVVCGSYTCSDGANGCNWDQTCGATPTPTPSASCDSRQVYDKNWVPITDFSTIKVGQIVYLATRGSTNDPQGITKAKFRINGGVWQETQDKHGDEFYIQHTILTAGSYLIESMVYNPTLGWW